MDELTKRLPELIREETIPQIPKRIRWKGRIFGKTQIWEYMRNYYEEESASRVPFYLPYVYMKEIFRYLCRYGHLRKREVSMVLIDGGDARIDYFLFEFLEELNFLTIVTERREYFTGLQERAFQELGLLIELVQPWEEKTLCGNLVWDFTEKLQRADCYPKHCVCFAPHKKKWKIQELLRECPTVTAVAIKSVECKGMTLTPKLAESFLVPANFPFRKSRCEDLKSWCRKKQWTLKPEIQN